MTSKPAWWVLYVLALLLAGLFFVVHEFIVSVLGQEVVEFGILLLIFGLMALWVSANARAIAQMDKRERGEYRIITYAPAHSRTDPVQPEEQKGQWN
ncbi:MAG: hypothetical protein WCF84_09120 [Anaerolineae bacterium]